MSIVNNSTITITGMNGEINKELMVEINRLLADRGLKAAVRVEPASIPHHFQEPITHIESVALSRYNGSVPETPSIALNGLFTVKELDGISFKLRGGK